MAETEPPPPTYAQATGRHDHDANATQAQRTSQRSRKEENEDQLPLPNGWIRQHDPTHDHCFYVDTSTRPPRSIWQHPYFDDDYLQSLPPLERDRVQSIVKPSETAGLHASGKKQGIPPEARAKIADDAPSSSTIPNVARPTSTTSSTTQNTDQEKKTFGRKMKDKLTGSTHAEREQDRWQRRQEEERRAAEEAHLRNAVARAESSGKPQHIGRDKYGHDIYVEPSYSTYSYQTGGYGPTGRVSGYPGGGQYYVPQGGPYGDPNARFVRAQRGSSFGGGYGLPIAGGLLGGLLLGGLLAGPF